jgi:hypothetical protein
MLYGLAIIAFGFWIVIAEWRLLILSDTLADAQRSIIDILKRERKRQVDELYGRDKS